MKDYYRALFTLRCIKKVKDYRKLLLILDNDIMEAYKNGGKIPTQYEIYIKYHPDAAKATAEANASLMKSKFEKDLKSAIKEKFPEIIL